MITSPWRMFPAQPDLDRVEQPLLDRHDQPGLDELEQAEEGDDRLLEGFLGVEVVQEIEDAPRFSRTAMISFIFSSTE